MNHILDNKHIQKLQEPVATVYRIRNTQIFGVMSAPKEGEYTSLR